MSFYSGEAAFPSVGGLVTEADRKSVPIDLETTNEYRAMAGLPLIEAEDGEIVELQVSVLLLYCSILHHLRVVVNKL